MADRPGAAAAAPTRSTIRGDEWLGGGLSGQRHDAVRFVEVDLTGLDSRGVLFTDCTFQGVRFNATTHADGAFLNCTFINCTFWDTSFTGCKLVGSHFDRCRFGPLTVQGGDWSLVGLRGADLGQADIRDTRMREADLTGARLDGAVVRSVDLAGAWLHRASFVGTDLRGSDISALDPRSVEITDALIDVEQSLVIATALGLRIG